jgi:NAD(P)-dependent dehydrogenase (short-subunit alcohol dehydrogenase family)
MRLNAVTEVPSIYNIESRVISNSYFVHYLKGISYVTQRYTCARYGRQQGIGAAIARKFAAYGADVAITYEKSSDLAAEVVRDIKAQGRGAVAIRADSADVDAIRHSVEKSVGELGGLDILVNNAGILRHNELTELSLEDIDAQLDVSVRGPAIASKPATPHLNRCG